MNRIRLVLTALAWALAISAVGLDVSLGSTAGRINIRWADAASEPERERIEQDLLTDGRLHEGRTWSYRLLDDSSENIERIVAHPLVADTHHIDRARFRVARDPSKSPEWIRRVHQFPIIRDLTDLFLPLALVFGTAGVVGIWPVLRHGVTRIRYRAPGAALFVILLASLLLRITLVVSGGSSIGPTKVATTAPETSWKQSEPATSARHSSGWIAPTGGLRANLCHSSA